MRNRCLLLMLILAPMLAVAGCATTTRSDLPSRPATINHFVVFKLKDAAQSDALIRDCDTLLGTIPGVVSYFAGQHHDVGRDTVFSDYDVGLFIGFNSDEAYEAYVVHPNHVHIVERWRPGLEWMRVYDVYDDGTR